MKIPNRLKNYIFLSINILLSAMVFLLIFFGLWKIGLIDLPKPVLDFIGKTTDTPIVLPGDDGKIYAALKSGKKNASIIITPDISQDNLHSLIENMQVESSYYWKIKSTLYSNTSDIKTTAIIRFYHGSYRIELYNEKEVLTKLITDNKNLTVIVNAEGQSNSFPSGTLDLFSQAGVVFAEGFLKAPQTEDFEYTLIDSEYGKILHLDFIYNKGNYSQEEIYWISLDYGLVVRAEAYENDKLIYLLETEKLSILPDPSSNLFEALPQSIS